MTVHPIATEDPGFDYRRGREHAQDRRPRAGKEKRNRIERAGRSA